MSTLSRICLMLAISLSIALPDTLAEVQLEPLEREYQSAQAMTVTLPLTFTNTASKQEMVSGSWQWINHQQQCMAQGDLPSTPVDALTTKVISLRLPVGTSKHYKLQLDWQSHEQSHHDILDMITDSPHANRPSLLLSGAWEQANHSGFWPFDKTHRHATPQIPDNLKWSKTQLPKNVNATSEKEGVIHWYRRSLQLPNWLKGDAYELVFQGIGKRAHVWINNQHIAYLEGAWTSYTLDISNALKAEGDNEILIATADHTAQKQDALQGTKFNWPIGHSGNAFAGIYDHLWLRARASVFTRNWQWRYDHDTEQLKIKALIVNASNHDLTQGSVFQIQLDEEKQTAFATKIPIAIPAHGEQLVMATLDVKNAKLWWPAMSDAPGTPHLYGMKLNILQQNKLVDQIHDRIGLRSITVKNGLYTINNIPIHPVARGMGGWTGAWTWASARKKTAPGYGDFSRIHCNPVTRNVVEAAEESGHLVQIETPMTASGYRYPLDDADFWNNFRTQTGQLISEYRNNAAVVSMSLSNEVFLCGAERYPKALDQMAALWRWANARTPGWPVVVNGDGDLRNRIATANLHYPKHLSRHPLLPMSAYWLKHGIKQKLDLYPGMFTWKKNQLLEIGEDQWNGFSAWPHGCAIMQGDSVYGDDQAARKGHDAAAIQYMLGYRDANVAYHQPWSKTSEAARTYSFQPIAAYLVDQYHTTMPGQTMRWQVNVFNDSLATHTFKLRAHSQIFDVTHPQTITLLPAQKQRIILSITLPKAIESQDVPWELSLTDESNKIRFTDQHVLRMRQQVSMTQPQSPLYLIRGNGQLASRLEQLNLTVKILDRWQSLDNLPQGLLLVGANAPLTKMHANARNSLADFAQRGGHVMFFSQQQYPSWSVMPARIRQDISHDATLAHVLATDHPMLLNLQSADFQYWPSKHKVSEHDLYKPDTEGAVALLATGGRQGLAWSPLVFMPSGKGWFLLSQLKLLENWDKHPTPSRLLKNVLKHASQSQTFTQRKVYVLSNSNAWQERFAHIGITMQAITDPQKLKQLGNDWLLIPNKQWTASWTQPVIDFVKRGGHLWLMDWQSDGFKQLDEQCQISPLRNDLQSHSLRPNQPHPYTQMLSGFDCFWAQPTQGDPTSLANITRYSLADYAQGQTVELEQMTQNNAGIKNGLTSWGVPKNFNRVYNFKSQQQTLQWIVPDHFAGTYYIGMTGRVSHNAPRNVKQLSVAYVTQPFSWGLASKYRLHINDKPVSLRTQGDSVQVPIRAKGWAMPYGCMISHTAVTLKTGDVVSIGVVKNNDLWIAGLKLFKPRKNSKIIQLTQPGTLNLLRLGKGEIMLDGIAWEAGFKKVNRLATMMLNDLASGLGLAFNPYQSKVQSNQSVCQMLPDDAILQQNEGLPTLHTDGTRNMHTPFYNAVALRVPGQWGTWQIPGSLPKGTYQIRVIARVSNTSPRAIDLGKHYVLRVNGQTMPLIFDRKLGEPFVALQAKGWANVYGTLRSETALALQAGDTLSVGLKNKATAFVAMVQLVSPQAQIAAQTLALSGGIDLKLNRTIHINWPSLQQTVDLKTSKGLSTKHPKLTIDADNKTFKQLAMLQSFYHPWTDFAGQSADKPVAHCTVTYADNSRETFDVIYYQHVTMPLDAKPTLPQATRVWYDKQPFVDYLDDLTQQKGRWIQMQHDTPIYAMQWDNPHPDKPVASITMQLTQDGVLTVFQVCCNP